MVKYKRYLKKAREMPIDVLIKKLVKRSYLKGYHKARETKLKYKKISMKEGSFENWQSDIDFLFNSHEKRKYVEILREKQEVNGVIRQADKICAHTFNLLGSGDVNLGPVIKWNQDFKTGITWENNYHKKIKIIDLNNKADVKIPWELSRFQHLSTLGQAYWITGNEKYANEYKNQINSWIDANQVEMSVNWTCAMDVAIRACNWIVGKYNFKDSKIEEEFWVKLDQWLYMHGDFVYHNLENGEVNNNHYLSDLVGLVWLGLYFNRWDRRKNKAQKWLSLGLSELEVEVSKQVYNDGFNYEASTSYHCLVTELLLYTSVLCERNGVTFSESFNNQLEKMSEVIMNVTKPNGLIPQIGDMDSGRFIMFTGYGTEEMRDFRYLLGVAGEYFDRDDFRKRASNSLAAIWIFDNVNVKETPQYVTPLKSVSYPDGGIHIFRKAETYLLIRCGQNGSTGQGGHTHNDQLSFELNIGGEDFIVDPGTYVYTADKNMRNWFRSTKAHNTLQVENLEQNNFDEDNLFEMEDQTKAKCFKFENDYFVGEHYGFKNKNEEIRHKREIVIKTSNEIKITDYIINDNDCKVSINLNVAPGIIVSQKGNEVILEGKKNKVKIASDDNTYISIKNSYFSKAYGHMEEIKSICLESEGNNIKQRLHIVH